MKTFVKKVARRLLRRWLPQRFRSHGERTPTIEPWGRDVVRYPIQDKVFLAVYWKVLEHGRGPACALFVHGREVLRFDCFGEHKGHYHIGLRGDDEASAFRLFLPEKTAEEQIDRTLFELTTNLAYYLQRNPDPRVRQTAVAPEQLEGWRGQVKAKMLEYLPRATAFIGKPDRIEGC
jgi:hypothetical protein